jgi:hypothetical protein
MAFHNAEERDAFFERAHRGVAAGTAMRHVIGTNVGIWGDEQALMYDAAEITKYEIDTWAKENGEDPLGIPAEGIMNHAEFRKAFNACRKPNRNEMDRLVQSGGKEIPEDDVGALDQYLDTGFTEKLYYSLCDLADKYRNANLHHEEALNRLGMR